jgi:CIC family chloride channel protein
LARLGLASLLTGALIGVVGTGFRYCLMLADHLRGDLLTWSHGWPTVGWIIPALTAALVVGFARFLVVRFCPIAAGSGIQRVEAVMRGDEEPASWRIVPFKFIGGILAIGSGLALGREGPTVQMGAALARPWSDWLLPDVTDRRIVVAAGAGAGLAVAFNAPIGAAVFVLEELTRSVAPRLLIAALTAAAIAVAEMRAMLGNSPDFTMLAHGFVAVRALPLYLAFGALLGFIGASYNATIVALLDLSERTRLVSPVVLAALIGMIVGLVSWFTPSLVGGGEVLTQMLLSEPMPLAALGVALAVRFIIGPGSYASGTPGGVFAPLLLVGALCGSLVAQGTDRFAPGWLIPGDCAVVGMAGFFTAVVRTPLTGVILVAEMTGRADLALPLLIAALGAMVATTVIGSEPLYDTLRNRMPSSSGKR